MQREGISKKSEEAKGEKRQYYLTIFIRTLMKLFWIFPIQTNKIFCIVGGGKGYYRYFDNPKYITEFLTEQYPNRFHVVWAVNNISSMQKVKDTEFVRTFSISHFYHYSTAKVVITNNGMPTYMPKRKGQYAINTWHAGGAYKKNISRSKYRVKMNEYKGKCQNVHISSSKTYSDIIIPDLAPGYTGEVMCCGMPRNDIFFSNHKKEIRRRVCDNLNIDEDKILILYAPTYRGWFNNCTDCVSNVSHNWDLNVDLLCDVIEKRFGRKATFIFKKHKLDSSEQFDKGIDATLYHDTQELLCATDILISDYSSIIWDFSLTKRPCFLYMPDKDYYLNEDLGVYTSPQSWPGIVCETNEELQKEILGFDERLYMQKIENYHIDMGSYETGHACEKIGERIANICHVSV